MAEAARLSAAAKVYADCNCICIYYLQLASTASQPGRHTDSHTHTDTHIETHTQWHTHCIETDWLQLQRIPSPASAYYLYTSARRPCPPPPSPSASVRPSGICLGTVWAMSSCGSVNELFVGRCYARHTCHVPSQ